MSRWRWGGVAGLIPAYAGRTVRIRNNVRSRRAHPRLRGADLITRHPFVEGMGSSPLTRGGRMSRWRWGGVAGLIPAYAGRTCTAYSHSPAAGAHPRLRGADSSSHPARVRRVGSSPLTRGGHEKNLIFGQPSRLIPAYAGRTWACLFMTQTARAHPRLRGADCIRVTG